MYLADNSLPTITITVERYEELLSAEKELNRLEDNGVDNWEGY